MEKKSLSLNRHLTARDLKKIQAGVNFLQRAVDLYHVDRYVLTKTCKNGCYPENLDALVPRIADRLPDPVARRLQCFMIKTLLISSQTSLIQTG